MSPCYEAALLPLCASNQWLTPGSACIDGALASYVVDTALTTGAILDLTRHCGSRVGRRGPATDTSKAGRLLAGPLGRGCLPLLSGGDNHELRDVAGAV